MKQLLFLLLILTNSMLMAQSPTIDQKWKEIDQQMQNGQFKSIQPKIDELKALSRKQNNQQSYLKALFYEAKIKVATSDETDDVNFVFDLFKKDLDKKSNVNNAIVYSYLAELYQLYYNENRWKIQSRTNVENQATNDVRFWTEETFNKTINDYFSKSIQPKNELINAKSQDYKMILNLAEDKKNAQQQLDLTPTLYDVLAKKYINYLNQNDKKDKANQLLTDLVQLNTQKNNENAVLYNELILIDSKRGSTSVQEIIKQKESLATKYPKAWYSSYVYATLATDYYGLQEDKLANVNKIFEIQQKVAKLYPNSEELENINNLVSKIKSQELSVQAERYINENQNTPIQLTHKNLSQVFVKIFAYNEGFDGKQKIQALNVYNENRISEAQKFLNSLKVVEQYTIDVKSFEDYQNHSTIVKLNPLKSGRYIVLFSNNSEFKINTKDDIDYLDVMVSKYAINSLNEKVSVVNRETGKPESNVAVEFSNLTNYNKKEFKILTSDKDGMITIPSGWRNLQYRVKDEHTIYSAYYYDYDRYDDDNDSSVKIFTDRAIYRPGQTVYFKGIYYSSNDKSRNVVPNSKLTIALFDVNGKELSKVDLTTNEFGSVNGSFVLPSSALTGNFTIRPVNVQGYYSFKVEEYKRPKFKVEIEKNKGVYSLNDKVKVEGKAIAFSGANIDNAKVSYRVYRQEIFTFWPWYRSIPADRGEREEITFGDTTTDAEGKFNFEFVAKPASEKKKDEVRTYNYFIEVNATDINGETQSESSSVKVGDTRMSLNVAVSEKTKADDLKAFKVEVKNLNDEKLDGKGHIEIYSLNAPKEVVRRQKFTTDYNVYSKEEFKKLFPNEPYGDEMNPKTWTTNQKVFESDFDTKVSDEIQFNQASNLEEGYYVFKGFVMDGTQKVEVDKLVYVSNEKKANEIKTLLAVSPNQSTYQPKDVAKIEFKSGSKNTFVYYEVEANQTIIEKGFLDLSKKSVVEIPIKEEYRGGIYVNYAMTKFNDVQTGSLNLAIPFTNKQLKVTAEVLRDKLTPGAKEKWQLKIEGPNKDKVSAEVLASMYDASLDQFASNSLDFNVYNFTNSRRNNPFNLYQFYSTNPSRAIYYRTNYDFYARGYAGLDLNLFDFGFNQYRMNRMMRKSVAATIQMNNELAGSVAGVQVEAEDAEVAYVAKTSNSGEAPTVIRGNANYYLADNSLALYVIDGVVYDKMPELNPDDIQSMNVLKGEEATALYGARGSRGVVVITTKKGAIAALDNVKARTNLNETAFFYPNLKTDAKGSIIVEFTTPESLTEWKFMAIAHTPDLKTGYLEQNVRTQKDLMVVPNMPRFLREGDQISVSSKINNLSDKVLNGSAKLMLFDAFTNQPIEAQFKLTNAVQNFSVAKGSSDQVTWTIDVPKNVQAVVYRVVASAGDFSDGEESALPILTNRMMVTETLPIYVKEGQKKLFQFENMINNKSTSLDNFKLTFEMTTNPIWYAIFSLPYLREYPYECAEQVFSRLYGNMISEKVINSNPKIKAVFDDWNKKGELKSKLQLNQELKNIILEETPWVKNAESEEEQMKQIAVLFQLNQMQTEMKSAFQKLSDKQQSNGGFAWFDGGRPNEYITTHIVSGFGNMKKMDVNFKAFEIDVNPLIKKAIQFIDDENLKRFKEFKKDQKSFKDVVYSDGLHYLYARSFFLEDYPMSKELEEMKTAMLKNLNDTKLDLSLQQKAMAAIVMNRFQMQSAAKIVVNSIKEKAVESDEMGMYWKENQPGWFWYQAPVETQSLLIEAFDEVTKDEKSVEEMKVWLLKNRQTNQWNSTKATTKAVYALMNFGKSWIDADKGIEVKIGNQKFDLDKNSQAGSGYVKTSWNKEEIKPEMGKIEVAKTSPGIAWGAMYWQYFEDLDKIKSAETGIKFNKKLFVKSNSANGPILKEITTSTPIKVGDIVTVRLEISVDRNMQFVHIKDMRASGFEPVNVLSGYKWKGEFGYYESTRDAATNFFSDYMRKGTYVFEYDLKANNAGNFSNGITSMQNMYAPELSAQSEGIRVEIK